MENISLEGNDTSNEEEKNQEKELEFENNYEILGREDIYYKVETGIIEVNPDNSLIDSLYDSIPQPHCLRTKH